MNGLKLEPGWRQACVVELVLAEVEAAHQRLDGTGARVHGNERTLDLGQLGDLPGVLGRLRHADHRAAADLDIGWRLGRKARLRGPQAFTGDLHGFAVGAHGLDFLGAGLQYHRRHHVAVVGMLGQCVVHRLVGFLGVVRQVDEALGPAVRLAALVVHDALAQRLVGRRLVGGNQRRVDLHAAGVNAVAVLRVHHLAHRLGHVLGMQPVRIGGIAQVQFFLLGFGRLLGGDEAGLLHAVDHIELPRAGAPRVDHRVVGAGRLRQAGQHGGFGRGDVLQRLAEIRLGCRREAIGAVAQVDLVQVDLQDLVLGELLLEPQGQQDLVGLAAQRALGTEVHIARHLHGDGRGALLAATLQAGHGRARKALVVDTAVVVEARVFHSQHGVFHYLRNVGKGRERAALLAEFADERAFDRIHAQRQLGAIVGKLRDVGQPGRDDGHRHAGGHHQNQCGRTAHDGAPPRNAPQPHRAFGARRFGGRRGIVHGNQ